MKYKNTGMEMIMNPVMNLQISDHSFEKAFCFMEKTIMKRQKPAKKPTKVYLTQKSAPVIIPHIRASVFAGSPSPLTIALRPLYKAMVIRGKQSSSALPPKLNILIVYTLTMNKGMRVMEYLEGFVKSLTVFQEYTAKTPAAIHSMIHEPTNDLSEISADKAYIK